MRHFFKTFPLSLCLLRVGLLGNLQLRQIEWHLNVDLYASVSRSVVPLHLPQWGSCDECAPAKPCWLCSATSLHMICMVRCVRLKPHGVFVVEQLTVQPPSLGLNVKKMYGISKSSSWDLAARSSTVAFYMWKWAVKPCIHTLSHWVLLEKTEAKLVSRGRRCRLNFKYKC